MGINRNTNIYFILLFALLMPLGQFAHAKSPCVELISKSSHLYPFPKLSNVKLHLKFGFESEYTIDKFSHKLLGFYYPDPSLGISKQEWRALGEYSAGARVEWLTANLTQVFAHKKEPGKIKKQTRFKKFSFLPESLIVDYTGNLEIVVDPVDTFEEWSTNLDIVRDHIGPGSMQATVGIPKRSLFSGDKDQIHSEIVGMLQLLADVDALDKLEKGFEKFKNSPDAQVAKAFAHPFLGPLTAKKRSLLESVLAKNISGEGFDEESRHRVAMLDDSFKYIGSTAYRPDLGGEDYVVFEVRNAHSDFELLKELLARIAAILSSSREKFAVASQIRAFDSQAQFDSLPKNIQSCLANLFPAKFIDPDEEYSPDEILANQVYRNFAFPLRDWSIHFALVNDGSLKKAFLAQTNYVRTLSKTCSLFADSSIGSVEASVVIQGALARFAHDLDLRSSLDHKFLQNLSNKRASGF